MMAAAHPKFKATWTNVAFRPYLLNPELEGTRPVNKILHLEGKLGKAFSQMRSVEKLKSEGAEYGLSYRFGAEDMASDTIDSHRLLQYVNTAEGTEATLACRRELMRLYNEEGRALSDHELLLAVAKQSGVDEEVVGSILESAAYRMDVIWMSREARKGGIDMVPHYRFYTSEGLHTVADFYNEWHFLDALYRTFPKQPSCVGWEAAGRAAREVVQALNDLNQLQRAKRKGQDIADADLERAEDSADALRAEFCGAFLGGAREGSFS